MRPKAITLMICFVLAGLSNLVGRSSSGQQQFPPGNRKPACSCFCGGSPDFFNLFAAADINAGKCYGGPLPADKCGDHFKSLPEQDQNSVCQNLKAKDKSTSCPALKTLVQYCKEKQPPDTDCEKPAPWFDTSSSSRCKDVQDTQITIDQRTATATVSMCGYTISRIVSENFAANADPLFRDAYTAAFKQEIPKKVCCDKFREAARTGAPCDPRADVDCDGTPNQKDISKDPAFPTIDIFSKPNGATIDPFPPGFDPYDPNFQPDSTARASKGVGDCACKWQLIKGELTCNGAVAPNGTKQHVYIATWRCPTTKAEVFTTKYAPATAPCR